MSTQVIRTRSLRPAQSGIPLDAFERRDLG